MSLSIHRSERADALVAGLAALLADAPGDPFTPDVVAVPSKGVERWIAQSLAAALGSSSGQGDGVCANVVFPSPGRVVRDATAAAVGIAVEDDPWAGRRLPWSVLEVIDGCAGEDWCVTLARHLGSGGEEVARGRRVAVAQKLAGLFATYGAERPTMLLDWLEGRDTDGYGGALEPDHAWQAELWRRVREHLAVESPAERIAPACERLRSDPGLLDLPDRLSVFGATRLASDELRVLDALAAHRDLHLWLPFPSHRLWERVVDPARRLTTVPTRREDRTADVPRHPLGRSLARDARELEVRLLTHTEPAADRRLPHSRLPATLLGRLQSGLHGDRPPQADHRVAADDRSVQVHACHGRQRQVEVLREVLLGLLTEDETLELRDIIVMCPDIEAYAPLIHAAFGGFEEADETGQPGQPHPGHRLTIRLADRSLRQTNPVLGVAARLLELADGRLTASDVLDLAAMPPVRHRFGFDEEALERLGDWVRRAGVRWGLDAEGRGRYGLERIRQNTWQSGLDRLLVGVVMDEDDLRTLDVALPLDDVDSTEIDLAGRFAELLDRLAAAVDHLGGEQSLETWVTGLTDAVESLVAVSPLDAWQVSQARWQLTDAVTSADRSASTDLRLSDVRALLADRLKGRPTRANFRTGHLTMCTMVPMRSVPHRVVCLLGLDDGVFPRGARVDGDDILARTPRVGERDPRSEDRQLFLDAILAAEEKLVILYTGADERTGAERPPAVPVGELLDVLDRTAAPSRDAGSGRSGGRGEARDRVLVRHPLQPFDARNFQAGELGGAFPAFSFDRAAFDGSRALLGGRPARPAFLEEPLPDPPGSDVVELDSLIRFLENPVKQFLRQRLGLSQADEQEGPEEAIPVAPDPLELWEVGHRLLEAGLAGVPAERAVRAEWLRGQLPPGRLGNAVMEPIVRDVTDLVDRTSGLRTVKARHLDVAVELDSGVTVVGTVPGVRDDCVLRVVYSRLGPKHRLRAWLQMLALAAQWPDQEWQAKTVGRGSREGAALAHVRGVSGEDARGLLEGLVAMYHQGMCRPLPLPPKSACAYAEKRRTGAPVRVALANAGRQWRSGTGQNERGEFTDPDFQQVWGEVSLSGLLRERPDPADTDWPEESSRFGQLARRVWDPLLTAEVVH